MNDITEENIQLYIKEKTVKENIIIAGYCLKNINIKYIDKYDIVIISKNNT